MIEEFEKLIKKTIKSETKTTNFKKVIKRVQNNTQSVKLSGLSK